MMPYIKIAPGNNKVVAKDVASRPSFVFTPFEGVTPGMIHDGSDSYLEENFSVPAPPVEDGGNVTQVPLANFIWWLQENGLYSDLVTYLNAETTGLKDRFFALDVVTIGSHDIIFKDVWDDHLYAAILAFDPALADKEVLIPTVGRFAFSKFIAGRAGGGGDGIGRGGPVR